MARAATARARIEEAPVRTGYSLLIAVALGMVFLFFMAFLSAVKTPPLFNEGNMLYLALIFFGGAAALYIGFGVSGVDQYVQVASYFTAAGFVATTLAAGHRWYVSGHPPFSNMYEMLLSFVWTVAVLTLVAEKKFGVRIIGSITMPLAVISVLLMQLMNSEVRPLVPALQSTWLHIHVTLAMLAYAACALSFALALMFLIKDHLKTETFLATTSALTAALYIGILTRFERWGGLSVAAWDSMNPGAPAQEIRLQGGGFLMVTIPELGWLVAVVLLAVLAPLAIYGWARVTRNERLYQVANRAVVVGIVLQVLGLVAFVLRTRAGSYASPMVPDRLFATSLAASPFLLAAFLSGIFASLLYLMLVWRRNDLERLLPTADSLDRITYQTIGIAFPLLTLMIAAGAYWANRTWGSYWSWDPKETWAAITWLVYAGYLHMRITRGWRGRRAAYFAVLGFAVVMFTFFGVTYVLGGIHAYA